MKMHSAKFKDPWISRAQPVALMTPVIEEGLRLAAVTASREQVIVLLKSRTKRINPAVR